MSLNDSVIKISVFYREKLQAAKISRVHLLSSQLNSPHVVPLNFEIVSMECLN